MKKDIIKGNVIIAEFMGIKGLIQSDKVFRYLTEDDLYIEADEFEYSYSENKMTPVIGYCIDVAADLMLHEWSESLQNAYEKLNVMGQFKEVVKFIEWYKIAEHEDPQPLS